MAGAELQERSLFDDLLRDRAQLISGGGLVVVGGLVSFVGVVLVTSAAVAAARRWMDQLQPPPREMARQKWQQARSAMSAGVGAWQAGNSGGRPAT